MEVKTMTTKEFIEKVNSDAALAEKFQNVKTPEECYEIAKAVGLTDSFEVFLAVAKEIKAEAEKLNPAEIDAVSGGVGNTTLYPETTYPRPTTNTITTITTTTTACTAGVGTV